MNKTELMTAIVTLLTAAWTAYQERRHRKLDKAKKGDPAAFEAARKKAGLSDEGGGSRVGKEARKEWDAEQARLKRKK